MAGLPVYLDLAKVLGLSKSIEKHLKIRENSQGWTDVQAVTSLVLLNLAGGNCVDDQTLPGMEDPQLSLPFPTMQINSEQVHSIMEKDLAGGTLPSGILEKMQPGGG